jgi:hypothetical protein
LVNLFKSSQVGLSEYQGEVVSASSFPEFFKISTNSMFKTKFSWGAVINRFGFSDLGFKSIQNKVFKIYLGQLVRYGTEIIKA